jgi:hypothetical protein
MDRDRIKAEANAFFEWPTEDKTHVTTTSMLLFAEHIAKIAAGKERGRCVSVCLDVQNRQEERFENEKDPRVKVFMDGSACGAEDCATEIMIGIER